MEFSIVKPEEAGQSPYPYIYVMEDGSYRELTAEEKAYLEEPFSPFDGARPYVKGNYEDRTSENKISGFLRRDRLPPELQNT